MTVNIDTRLIPNVRVDDKLMALLQEMTHFNPAFSYEATDSMGYNEHKRICTAAVFLYSNPVGKAGISKRFRDGAQETVYEITSDGINKRRGSYRNTTSTKHMKIAMRAVREAFKCAETSLVAERLVNDAQSKVERIQSWARDHVRSVLLNAVEPVLSYLQTIDNGTASTNGGLPPALTQQMGGTNWQDRLRDHRIAKAVYEKFSAKHGVVVRIMRDETMQVVDLQTAQLSVVKSSYELPVNYQEKLTILKIMNEDQPIEHVGFKFSDHERINGVRNEYQAFFLIDGPTYTNSD